MTLTSKIQSRGAAEKQDLAASLYTGDEDRPREAMIVDCLAGRCERSTAVDALGPKLLDLVDGHRAALEADIEWALGA